MGEGREGEADYGPDGRIMSYFWFVMKFGFSVIVWNFLITSELELGKQKGWEEQGGNIWVRW